MIERRPLTERKTYIAQGWVVTQGPGKVAGTPVNCGYARQQGVQAGEGVPVDLFFVINSTVAE
ncbi:MAG: hypothetical protein ACRDQ4_22175, partial [Pseudonocardiaceae bacterium]